MTLGPPTKAGRTDHSLVIEFLGSRWELAPGEQLRFGRSADIVIDDNPFMHRVVGRFVHREGVWWLQNFARRGRLDVRDGDQHTTLEVAPRQQIPIASRSFAVRFTAGPTTYELEGRRDEAVAALDQPSDVWGTPTIDFGAVPLSPEQHLLIVALYSSGLRCPAIEGNSIVGRRLGWTAKKFNRKLDAVCDKLSRAGVRGLKGSPGEMADTRREVLVEHALRTGLISPDDLGLLDLPDPAL